MARPPDPRLLCRNGHPVEKLKKLKSWQGHLHGKECSICNAALGREEDRWTCTEKCNWNVCRKCYDAHWNRTIRKASQTSDDTLRELLLNAVPQARRRSADYFMAEQGRKAHLTPSSNWRVPSPGPSGDGSVRSGTASGRGSPSAALYKQERWYEFSKLHDERVQVALWLAAGSAATGLALWSSSVLLRSEDLAFPHPFLLVGLSQVGALLLCRLAAYIVGRFAPPTPTDSPAIVGGSPPGVAPGGISNEAEWKAAGILGIMFGVDICIGASILYHLALASRDAAYALSPAVMLGAGVLAGADPPQRRCIQAIAGVTLGGLLMVSNGFDDWAVLEMGLLALLADALKMFRWIFTRNVLPQESGVPLLVFAARMTTPAAALGFELTFVFDFSSYPGLFSLPQPGKVAALLLTAALALAVKITSELHLAQLTSVTVLGLFSPICHVGVVLLAAMFGGGGSTSVVGLLGAVVCMGGMAAYGYLRQHREEVDHFIAIEPPAPGYVRLPADGQVLQPQMQRPSPPMHPVRSAPLLSGAPARQPGAGQLAPPPGQLAPPPGRAGRPASRSPRPGHSHGRSPVAPRPHLG